MFTLLTFFSVMKVTLHTFTNVHLSVSLNSLKSSSFIILHLACSDAKATLQSLMFLVHPFVCLPNTKTPHPLRIMTIGLHTIAIIPIGYHGTYQPSCLLQIIMSHTITFRQSKTSLLFSCDSDLTSSVVHLYVCACIYHDGR